MQITYGTPTEKSGIAVRIGVEKGFFREIGIELDVRTVFGGPELAAAYDSGEMVIGQIGSPPGINAIFRGSRFRIVGSGMRQKLHSYLGVRPDIVDFEGLRGTRVGILSRGSCAEWFLRAMLRHRDLDPDEDVEIIELKNDYPRFAQLVTENRIDSAVLIEPNLSMAEAQGVLHMLVAMYDETYLPETQWIIRVANCAFIQDEPELAASILDACLRSARHVAEHPEVWAEFVCRRYGLDRKVAARAAGREFPHFNVDGAISVGGLRNMIRLQHELGAIDALPDVESFLDRRFVQTH